MEISPFRHRSAGDEISSKDSDAAAGAAGRTSRLPLPAASDAAAGIRGGARCARSPHADAPPGLPVAVGVVGQRRRAGRGAAGPRSEDAPSGEEEAGRPAEPGSGANAVLDAPTATIGGSSASMSGSRDLGKCFRPPSSPEAPREARWSASRAPGEETGAATARRGAGAGVGRGVQRRRRRFFFGAVSGAERRAYLSSRCSTRSRSEGKGARR